MKDDAYHQDCVTRIMHTRERLVAELNTRGFTVLPSAANFVFASPVKTNKTAQQVFDYLNQRDVLVRHWAQAPIENWLRISIGTESETDKFLTVLDSALASGS